MKPKKRSPRRRKPLATPLFDDGIPVDPFSSGDTKEGRKAKQLCRQVAETLDMVLSGECRDESLQSLHVLSVVPAPNASRLLVIARADLPEEEFDRDAILAELDAQSGRLRAEIAASIHRKRTPLLTFHDAILAELDAQSGRLRAEIAASIHRKRTPLLTFHVIGPTWMPSGSHLPSATENY